MRTTITIDGDRKLRDKLTGRRFMVKPTRDTMNGLIQYGLEEAQKRAPVGESGRTRGALHTRIDARPMPRFADLLLRAVTSPDGFRYPFALDASRRVRYRHRSGARQGRLTRSWFRGVTTLIRRRLRTAVRQAAKTMVQEWERS